MLTSAFLINFTLQNICLDALDDNSSMLIINPSRPGGGGGGETPPPVFWDNSVTIYDIGMKL